MKRISMLTFICFATMLFAIPAHAALDIQDKVGDTEYDLMNINAAYIPGDSANDTEDDIGAEVAPLADFETRQQEILKRLEAALDRVVAWETRVNNNTYISDENKALLMETLEDIHTNIYAYITAVQETTTMEELREVNKEALEYLRDNKDAIKETARDVAVAIGEEALKYAEDVMEAVEFALDVMKVLCDEEATTIEATEELLEELSDLVDSLESAIELKDMTQIKLDVKEILLVSAQIYDNLEDLEEACLM